MSDDDTDEDMYSITSSKTIYKRTRSRSDQPKFVRSHSSYSDEESSQSPAVRHRRSSITYGPVAKWAVDYNNRNYVRSKCIKNIGLHRQIHGRPLDWHVDYDNYCFNRSKVNPLKGYHRRIPDVKRKYTPDDDDLADATGWEFDCGPEYDQFEQDVTFIPEGRIVGRGCYRWYGTRRNDSDCDLRQEEIRENLLNEELEREFRYTDEFLQADRQHLHYGDAKDRHYVRGGYRFYETMRNAYDILPEVDFEDPEWRRKHHCNGYRYLDLDMCRSEEDGDTGHEVKRGKPFRATILNKVYQLRKRESPEQRRYGTRVQLMPGEGEETLYHGVPDRHKSGTKRNVSARSAFKRPIRKPSKYEEQYRVNEAELRPQYSDRRRRIAPERKRYGEYEEASSLERVDYSYRAIPKRERSAKFPEKESKRTVSRDVKETFDTWRDKADKSRSYPKEYRSKTKPNEIQETSTEKGSKRTITKDVKDTFDSWRDKADRSSGYSKEDRKRFKPKENRETFDKRRENTRNRSQKQEDAIHYFKEKIPRQSRSRNAYLNQQETMNNRRNEDKEEEEDRKSKPKRISNKISSVKEGQENSDNYKDETPREYIERRRKYSSKGHKDSDETKKVSQEKENFQKKVPPHVKNRMKSIEEKVRSSLEKFENKKSLIDESLSPKHHSIDLVEHKDHPHDRGHNHKSEREEYLEDKDGSETWVKEEENITELHHKSS